MRLDKEIIEYLEQKLQIEFENSILFKTINCIKFYGDNINGKKEKIFNDNPILLFNDPKCYIIKKEDKGKILISRNFIMDNKDYLEKILYSFNKVLIKIDEKIKSNKDIIYFFNEGEKYKINQNDRVWLEYISSSDEKLIIDFKFYYYKN